MKKRKICQFFAVALALAMASCSSEDMPGGVPDDNVSSKDAVYMNVTVQLPVGTGSRSTTNTDGGSSDGTEVGQNYENEVKSVLLVLAKTDNSFIGCAEKFEDLSKESSGKVTAIQSISKSTISAYYGTDGKLDASKDEDDVNVFVFCNPTEDLRRILGSVSAGDDTWYDQVCTISEIPNGTIDNAAIWGGTDNQGGFLMSSYSISKKQFPVNFSDWDKFTTKENPFKLSGINTGLTGEGMSTEINNDGAIKVERSVARFDFKDGSKLGDNTYDVVKNGEDVLVQIQLQRMALVNMSKNFYYLRRVSNDGLKTGADYKLCGTETDANYVVDTDAADKNSGAIVSGNKYAEHFNFCLGRTYQESGETKWTIDEDARGQWFASKIGDVLDGTEDNDDTWNKPNTKGDYRIWRYVTENTIPGSTANQKQGITTGVVFKGKMIATEKAKDTELYGALNDAATGVSPENPILYAYGSDIYVRWTEVRAMAIKLGPATPMYKAVFGNTTVTPVAAKAATEGAEAVSAVYSDDSTSPDYLWNAWYNGGKDNEALKAFKGAATSEDAGFTLYERSEDPDYGKGYYCYYFYWNRHNDNGNNNVMRPMEFSVVRNNVYKLAVTNISRLGHPRISENDPDPVDPDDPDENGDVYLSVSCEVLPWVVRVNNIEF